MQQIDLPYFVDLGAAIEHALRVDPERPVADAFVKFMQLEQKLEQLRSGDRVKLTSALHNLDQVLSSLRAFENRHFRGPEGKWKWPDESDKDEWGLRSINGQLESLKTVLIADLRTCSAFSAAVVGIFDIRMLVNSASRALDEETRGKISKETSDEVDASGKCLAFKLPTAAAFHAMRAVERVLKQYASAYLDKIDINRTKTWGGFISKLEKVRDSEQSNKPSDEALALLKQIKDIYRNPVIHPDRVLSHAEACTIFHSAMAAITRLVSEFIDAPITPELPEVFHKALEVQ